MPVQAAKQAYTREEVRRLLKVSERQLRSWEKQQLIPSAQEFGFPDLLALRTLLGLRASRIPPAQIRQAMLAIRGRLGEDGKPLTDVKIYSQGKKIRVVFAGRQMEPVSGQLLFDFDGAEIAKMLSFPRAQPATPPATAKQNRRAEAERWFEAGLELESRGASFEDVIRAYEKACEIDPSSAGALVNLGTVYFNLRVWDKAESYYRKAIQADPNYALAHYNLGNLFDESGNRTEALHHYLAALRIRENYGDAHYNVALLYQSINQPLKAVHHWKAYLKLDSSSNWAGIARRELGKLRELTVVRGSGAGPAQSR